MIRIDEDTPHSLIVYMGDGHATVADYESLIAHWAKRVEQGERFGVIMVEGNHDHDDDHDHDEAEHAEMHAQMMHLINEFRRTHRHQTLKINTGFARVVTPEFAASSPISKEDAEAYFTQYAEYNWGIPGAIFLDIEDAKAWLAELYNRQPTVIDVPAAPAPEPPTQKRVGLFYGSSTGYTEYVAFEIAKIWEATGQEPLQAVNIGDLKQAETFLEYDCLILGIPTWNIGELQDDWDILFPQLDSLDFTGKKIALFGVGDQYGYPFNFLDAMGILGNKLIERGAVLVGYWNDPHYDFTESIAFIDGRFMGLGIDELHQHKLTPERLNTWIPQVIQELALPTLA